MSEDIKDYSAEELLSDYSVNLEDLESDLLKSEDELRDQLEDIGKKLEKRMDELSGMIKKDLKALAIKFYHDHKDLVDSGLKGVNSAIHKILKEVNRHVDAAITATEDKQTRKKLLSLKAEVIKFSIQYNLKYAALKTKLALSNAGIELKNIFK